MAVDKKQRLVPGSMYIPPTPPIVTAAPVAASIGLHAPTPVPSSSASASSASKSSSSPKLAAASLSANAAGSASTLSLASTAKALTPNKPLGDLLRSIDPRFCFHPAVEELLLDMASDFVEDVVGFSSKLTKHRRSTELDAKDLQFCLAKNYGISLVGASVSASTAADSASLLNPLGADVHVRARPAKTSLHMHRLALKRKTLQRTSAKLKKGGALKVSDGSGGSGGGGGGAKKVGHRKNSSAGLSESK